ncbi:MAG: HAMP domain-containing histidine kinase [Gemmatimonadetes bacterium]|uniref:histidine kinase n=1 Tax=Candidatus Kutchimonas denitrificans TaxID=3056748 RepID=A0AAE4Z504_9BACT|nr:HAMP domain-containing histidine kinase [Gemmatimonadota bacterium]NIR73643.1 HAMP domain-containing histidine kinase [Candidatus Kutchimonas denitrificans]NIR99602.1 HAMP domain-containing histidine kinase [Gemmatimonadota bacterium]NIT65222.1 HAMP domain-containing histidine kinase [Gemmatimonadota bacterium]NIV23755.1 hypothetical protein [Gemmatimonadota bacterium]
MRFVRNGKAPGRPRGTLLIVFLTLSLALAAGLAYQAVDAARSHRQTAESVLRDYARIAAWEFSRRAEGALSGAIVPAFRYVRETPAPAPGAALPPPRIVAQAIADDTCGCGGLATPDFFFRLDLADGTLALTPGSEPVADEARLAGTLAEAAPQAAGVHSGHPYLLADAANTGADVVAWALLKDRTGTPRAIYGFGAGFGVFDEALERTCSDEPLLPASIAGDQPNDSLLYIRLIAPDDGTMYESPVRYPERFSADDTLGAWLGGLVARAAVRPEAAARLVIGGLPASRLPLILGLLLVAAGVGAASLLQIRRERELARLRDDFVSGVSHELRTPLAQIQMFAELLDDEKLRSEEERRRSTRILRQESRRLTHLIENVLRFSRSRRVPARLALSEVDLETFIADTVDLFRPLAEARDVEVATDGGADLSVQADPAVLRQMLINLLDNAVKYGPPGQKVTIGAERVNGTVRIRVSDEGPGVPAAERGRVWEPYRRLERDANGPVGGSGIGLAVVRELTLRHGGAVRVEEAPGGGASFVIDLPIEPAAEASGSVNGNGAG